MPLSIDSEPVPLSADADGIYHVGNTRVTLDTLVAALCEGATPEEINRGGCPSRNRVAFVAPRYPRSIDEPSYGSAVTDAVSVFADVTQAWL
ncbi:MAG: hypothetical protein WCQ77_03495 [Planctomycetota bacterium]